MIVWDGHELEKKEGEMNTYASLHHRDLVGTACGGKTVCDEDDGLGASRDAVYGVDDVVLGVGIEGRCLWMCERGEKREKRDVPARQRARDRPLDGLRA